jgi:hypothetical protein
MNATTDHDLLNRLLDEAFAPYPATPANLDLKQEVRANLTARAAELQQSGATAADAARTALSELGDLAALVESGETQPAAASTSWVAEERRHRVRPKPAYALRTALIAGVLGVDVIILALQYFGVLPAETTWIYRQLALAALLIGVLVTDALRQETTVHYPMPRGRAIGFGVAAMLLAIAASVALQLLSGVNSALLVLTGLFLVGSIALFTVLGVTQTNRAKPWVVQAQAASVVPNRFDEDPASAARFGIYTAALWIVAFAAFIALSFTVGFAWSWLALLGGFALMMLILARMLFGDAKK